MFYENICSALNKKNIRFLVAGGVAVLLHGVLRMTADLDLLIALDPANVTKFISLMKILGYKPRIPVSADDFANPDTRIMWKKEKNMLVFSYITLSDQKKF